jgi:hypothetical protein
MKPIVENKQRSDVNVDFPDANTGRSLCQSLWSISSKQESPAGQENCSEEYSCCVFVICDGSSGLEAPPPTHTKKIPLPETRHNDAFPTESEVNN